MLQHGLIDSFWSSHAKLFWDCISEIEKTYYAAFDTFERAKNSAAGQKSVRLGCVWMPPAKTGLWFFLGGG